MGGEIRKIVICQLGALAVGKPVCKGASNQALKHNVPIIIYNKQVPCHYMQDCIYWLLQQCRPS